jgi:hypothetical protein
LVECVKALSFNISYQQISDEGENATNTLAYFGEASTTNTKEPAEWSTLGGHDSKDRLLALRKLIDMGESDGQYQTL